MLPQINAEEENSSRPTSAMSLGDEPTQRLFIQGSDEKGIQVQCFKFFITTVFTTYKIHVYFSVVFSYFVA